MLSDGELTLCGIGVTTPVLIFGHFDRNNLKDVWIPTPTIKELWRRKTTELEGVCSKCIHHDFTWDFGLLITSIRLAGLQAPIIFAVRLTN